MQAADNLYKLLLNSGHLPTINDSLRRAFPSLRAGHESEMLSSFLREIARDEKASDFDVARLVSKIDEAIAAEVAKINARSR